MNSTHTEKNRTNPWTLLGYVLGAAMTVIGVLVILGFFRLRLDEVGNGGATLRTVFGLVLTLYGIYRIVTTNAARLRRRRESDRG